MPRVSDPSGLGASGCEAICDNSVVENAHLERLRFRGERRFEPGPDTFAAALGARSRLKVIQVQATWTVAAFASFVHHLRANEVLEKVYVYFQHQEGNKNLPIGLVEELLTKYSFTLKTVILVPASGEVDGDFSTSLLRTLKRVMALVERNRRAREANSRLRDQPHEVGWIAVWPGSIGREPPRGARPRAPAHFKEE
jgi:hypothetical protein